MDWFNRWTFKSKLQKFIRKSLTDSLLSSKLKASTSLNEVEFDLFDFLFFKAYIKRNVYIFSVNNINSQEFTSHIKLWIHKLFHLIW